MSLPRAILKPRRAQPFFGRHPWVFAGAIAGVEGEPADGAEVELVSHTGKSVARGLFNSQSKIRVRLYSWDPDQPVDLDLFRERIDSAIRLRRDLLGLVQPGGACRLVFSESDGLSGLTVDRYDRWLAMQFTSLALAQRREALAAILQELTGADGIVLRTERGIGKLEGVELRDGLLLGDAPPAPVIIDEARLLFQVDLLEGQKTGFYLDQRVNRQTAARYAAGRSVLDAFCYTGGFGLHAARAGAASVECVDSSAAALELARGNARRNGLESVSFVQDDVFEHLTARASEGAKYGMIVLDPPKFARARHSIPDALNGYRRLQSLSLKLLERDGILVVCCCSGLITSEMLEDVLAQVATSEKREVQILERGSQSADHPVSISCRESQYLKCLIARVL
jgi:23S rRNA (cytosine1962-C5)-methyltransferase